MEVSKLAQPIEPTVGNFALMALVSLSTAIIAPPLLRQITSLNIPVVSPVSGSLYMAMTQIHPVQSAPSASSTAPIYNIGAVA